MAESSRDELRGLVETLPDERLQEAISLLKHLEDDEPLSAQEVANLAAGIEDVKHGRLLALADYERHRGL